MAKENDKGSEKTKEKGAETAHAEAKSKKTADSKKASSKESKAASSSKGSEQHAEAKPKAAGKKASNPGPARVKLNPRTFFAKVGEIVPEWKLVDVEGQPLGRVSTYIASTLMGKLKPTYTRHADTGDFVIVVNAEKVMLTGNKLNDKLYQYHTNYPGGLKTFTAKQILEKHPERLIKLAVYRMLPKGHMGRTWYKKLKVYKGTEHPHKAQQPVPVTLPQFRRTERV